jgi:hypothetical protein
MLATLTLSTLLSLSLNACSTKEIRHEDTADHVCKPLDTNCVPVTPGFIEERIENLVEIARLKKALESCEAQHQAMRFDDCVPFYPGATACAKPINFSRETFKCTVRGSLYTNQGAGRITERVDGCDMLDVAMTEEGIRVRHKSITVYIPVPMYGGHMQFGYRWGSDVATVGGKEFPVHVEMN